MAIPTVLPLPCSGLSSFQCVLRCVTEIVPASNRDRLQWVKDVQASEVMQCLC